MPIPIKNFAQSPTGNLYISDGFGKVRYWDGLTVAGENAGLAAPTAGLFHAAGSNSGQISGALYSRLRYVDRHGQPSNAVLGDATTHPLFLSGGSGSIVGATNVSPIEITPAAAHGLAEGAVVSISDVLGNTAANGTWRISVTAANKFTLTGTPNSNSTSGYQVAASGAVVNGTLVYNATLMMNVWQLQLAGGGAYVGSLVLFTGISADTIFTSGPTSVQAITSFDSTQPQVGTISASGSSFTGGTWYRLVSQPSGGSGAYTGGGTWRSGVGTINYTSVPLPTTQAYRRQILRTKNGDASVFYVDIDSTDRTATSFSSSKTDDLLGEAVPLTDLQGNDLAISRFGEPPNDKPFFSHHAGRLIGFGFPVWNQGKVAIASGSPTVTGQNTGWTSDMQLVGRLMVFDGGAVTYIISAFNATTQTMTLSTNYAGSTAISTAYAIVPDSGAGRRSFLWSDSQYPSAFDPTHSLSVPEDALAGESIASIVQDRVVYLCGESRVWRVSFQEDPEQDGAQALGPQRGRINSRTAVVVENDLYLMDRQGIYKLSGNSVEPVSTAVHDLFDPQRSGNHKINFRWSRYFHAVHDPEHCTIRWFVSMTGRYPRHALCYHYRFERWWIEEYPFAVGSAALGYLGGRRVVFLGAESRRIYASETGFADGVAPNSGTLRGTVSSAGLTWFQCNSAVFDSTWPQSNVVVDIVSGKGKGQRRSLTKIDATLATKFHVSMPWSTVPDTTSVFQIGGVKWFFKSGWYRFSESDQQQPNKVEVVFQPTDDESLVDMRLYRDHSADPVVWQYTRPPADNANVAVNSGFPDAEINSTEADGHIQFLLPGQRETRAGGRRFLAVSLGGVTNNERHRVYQVSLRGVTS